jgi:hypothetical protein
MMKKRVTCAAFLMMLAVPAVKAQVQTDKNCQGRIYGSSEVTRRARILKRPGVSLITRAVGPNARGVIVLDAVLCRSGRVTDIRIVQGLSPSINEAAAAELSMVRFLPAELRWHSVSTRMSFEFSFGGNVPGIKVTTSTNATGRLVENVNIIGHRRLTTEQILSWIKTRPGEPYRPEQLKRDFDAILATGDFDRTQTRVILEDGVRGGVDLTFEVVELPLVAEINFEGLKLDRSLVFDAWKKEHIDLRSGGPYDVVAVKAAVRIIKQLLDSNGLGNSRVETRTENVTSMNVNVIFVIKANR